MLPLPEASRGVFAAYHTASMPKSCTWAPKWSALRPVGSCVQRFEGSAGKNSADRAAPLEWQAQNRLGRFESRGHDGSAVEWRRYAW